MPTTRAVRAPLAHAPHPAEVREFADSAPWRLVAEASVDVRVAPATRRVLDEGLAARVDALTLGERIALARLAGPRTRRALLAAGDRPVLQAMLSHPRLDTGERTLVLDRLRGRQPVPEAAS
ncbi:MAG: hypothetical protein Kow0062_08310 [Acidobacteriota bacterium]